MFIGNINTIPSIVNLPGQNNRAFESTQKFVFDGGDGFLRSVTFGNYRFTDALAISCWVTFGSGLFGTGPQNYKIVDQATSNFNFGYSLFVTKTGGGTTFLRFRIGIGDATITQTQIRIDNITDVETKKFLILASYNQSNGEAELFLRGVGVSLNDTDSTPPGGTPIAYSLATNTFCIGNTSPIGSLEFDGSIDEVGIYNQSLNGANATELFDWDTNGNLQTYGATKNIAAWYRMGENASFVANSDPAKTGVWTMKNAIDLSDTTKNLTSSLTADPDEGNLPFSARQSPGIPPPE